MERSRCLLLVVALVGVMASPTAKASHAPRSRPQAAAAPAHHAAVHHAVQHRVVPTPARQIRVDNGHSAPRAPAVIRYVPLVRAATVYPAAVTRRVVAVPAPAPYYVSAVAQPVQEIVTLPSAGFPPDWNWRPVESFAALAPRANQSAGSAQPEVRYYCPDTREYFPLVETCNSSWLKVIP